MAVIVYGVGHIKTLQGILKISETIACLIGLILVAVDEWSTDLFRAFIVGTIIGLVVSLLLLMLHVTKIGISIPKFIAFQIYFNIFLFIYLLIVSAILLSKNYNDQYMAAGGFGLIAAILYLIDTIDCYRIDPSPFFCFK